MGSSFVSIYITGEAIAEYMLDSLRDIKKKNKGLDIEVHKNEVEVHKECKIFPASPTCMDDFCEAFFSFFNMESDDELHSILGNIEDISWEINTWESDGTVSEKSFFEFDKEDSKSKYSHTVGGETTEKVTEEKLVEKIVQKKEKNVKKRKAPKGTTPQISGTETPAELAEKWFDFYVAKYQALLDELCDAPKQYFVGIFMENAYFSGLAGSGLKDAFENALRIGLSDCNKITYSMQNEFDLDENDLEYLAKGVQEEDLDALRKAFNKDEFEKAREVVVEALGLTFLDAQEHPGVIKILRELFIEGASQCYDLNHKTEIIVDVSGVENVSSTEAKKNYKLKDNETSWTIAGYIGNETIVHVPGMIDGKPVYKIDDKAFAARGKKYRDVRNAIEEVYIPNTIKELGEEAFGDCEGLKKVVLSDAITKLQERTFINSGIKEIVLSSNLVKIMSEAFADCRKLESIDFPESVIAIGDRAFRDCNSLKVIKFPPHVKVIEEFTSSSKSLETIILPEDIEEIKGSAFSLAKRVKEVIAPNRYIKMGSMVFDDDSPFIGYYSYDKNDPATALIYFGKNLIGYKASYSGCEYEDVYVDDGTKGIVGFAISYVNNIKRFHIPESVVDIDEMAFNCSSSIVLCGKKGSVAEKFAKKYGYVFIAE